MAEKRTIADHNFNCHNNNGLFSRDNQKTPRVKVIADVQRRISKASL